MSAESNTTLVQQFYAAVWNGHNAEATDEYYAADFVENNPAMPGLPAGAAGARLTFAAFIGAFPDVHFTVEPLVAADDYVACHWTAVGTNSGSMMGMPPTGKPVNITGIDMFRIADGKIVERWGNFDQLKMLQQIGIIPG